MTTEWLTDWSSESVAKWTTTGKSTGKLLENSEHCEGSFKQLKFFKMILSYG